MLTPREQVKGKIGVFVDIKLYYVCVGFYGWMRIIQLNEEQDREK